MLWSIILIIAWIVEVGIREPPAAPMDKKCEPLGWEMWMGEMEDMGRAPGRT